jgi:hypothetical protein
MTDSSPRRRERRRFVAVTPMLVDDILPVFDVSDEVALVVDADPATTWAALTDADLLEVGRRRHLAGLLGALRLLPEILSHVLHGETPPAPPERMRLLDLTAPDTGDGGWVLLADREGEQLVLGLVGRFWRPVIQYAPVTADGFAGFAEPGFAKTVYALAVRPLEGGQTLLSGTMRTATTDEHARRWFRRYWTLGVGSGAHVLVGGLLELVRDDAEQRAGRAPGSP